MLRPNLNNSFHSAIIVPHSGGGQTNATTLNYGLNILQSPTTTFDSIKLPPAIAGSVVIGTAVGDIADFIMVFANDGIPSDKINQFSNNSGFKFPSVGDPNSQLFICVCKEDGDWYCNVGPA